MTYEVKYVCPHCNKADLFPITKEDFGTEMKAKCFYCGKTFRIKVPGKSPNKYNKWFWIVVVIIIVIKILINLSHSGLLEQSTPTQPTQDNSNIQTLTQQSAYQNEADIKERMKSNIVWVRYDISGKKEDSSYFEGEASGSGVLYSSDESNYYIFTNRHVIDCAFGEEGCYQRISEKVTVRTQDGKMYDVKRVLIAPHDLDMAVLEIDKGSDNYQVATLRKGDLQIGEKVTAIGYPSLVGNVLEFSVSDGQITSFKDLLVPDGFSFSGINSDAYTYFGSSGGGLFDSEGNLIGITTWGSSKDHIAIKISVIDNFESWSYCESGTYPVGDKCFKYCNKDQVLGSDGGCYNACKEFYCNSQIPSANDPHCKDVGYILGSDGYCHQACSSSNSYCPSGSICLRNRCFSCSQGYPYEDGTCRY